MSIDWKCHRIVVFVHDLPSKTTYNCRIEMMTEGHFFRQDTEAFITHRAIDILCIVVIARWQFE